MLGPRLRRLLTLAVVGSVLLVPASSAHGDDQLRVQVTPKRGVEVNQHACYRAVVTRNERPVKRAQVRLAAKAKKTNRRGVARVCASYPFPGVQTLHAFKDSHHDLARIRIRRGDRPRGSAGEWKRVELQLTAYPGAYGDEPIDVGCTGVFGDVRGQCWNAHNNGWVDSYVISGYAPVQINWGIPEPALDLRFSQGTSINRTEIRGTVPNAASGNYYVYAFDTGPWRTIATAGSDPSKAGEPGGPFLLRVTAHDGPFGESNGYTFHTIGYVYSQPR